MDKTNDYLEDVNIHTISPSTEMFDGEFVYRDQVSGMLLHNKDIQEYQQYYGFSGYDEYNDDAADCGE